MIQIDYEITIFYKAPFPIFLSGALPPNPPPGGGYKNSNNRHTTLHKLSDYLPSWNMHSDQPCFSQILVQGCMCQNFGTTSYVISLDHILTSLSYKLALSFPSLQILLAASCRFLLPDPHVGMLSSHPFVLLQNQKKQK
jgi:hypothetical protein